MASGRKTFVFADVIKHNNVNDCWLIISGKVYDVTTFVDDHPGSMKALLAATGKDATEDFVDRGHTDEAKELMKKYEIGDVDQSTLPPVQTTDPSLNYTYLGEGSRDPTLKILKYLLPFVMIGLAFTVKMYAKEISS